MRDDMRVGTWAKIDDGCPIEYSITSDDDVDLLIGDRSEGFEISFTIEAMERFLASASEALAEARKQVESGVPWTRASAQ